ncbi:hypothetical protein ACIBAB_03495 [Streptomyces rubiginosohelvolus]|uniref:hypothetical protein n=1 Tax=Streptomyces rubiginosohelvolus TaxID=67362 RepID=UPI0037AFB55C
MHAFREIAHHSGHADIVREALDGAGTTERMAKAAMGGESPAAGGTRSSRTAPSARPAPTAPRMRRMCAPLRPRGIPPG